MLLAGNVVTLKVSHNIEVAHRLFRLPGKCQQIHGHSMLVTLWVEALTNDDGYAMYPSGYVLEFGALKKLFRAYLDEQWDHHLHLNESDPLAETRYSPTGAVADVQKLPGLVTWPGDPSTENIARWIKNHIQEYVGALTINILIDETDTNGVEV